MTCINCGMGFIITPINLQGECPHCGYINSPLVLKEDNMVKKIVKWIWKIVCWPLEKAKQWLG